MAGRDFLPGLVAWWVLLRPVASGRSVRKWGVSAGLMLFVVEIGVFKPDEVEYAVESDG